MNSSADTVGVAFYRDGRIHIRLPSDVGFSFPIAGNPRLESGSEAQLNDIQIYGDGLHWPELDEDLSFEGILRGDYGQTRNRQFVH